MLFRRDWPILWSALYVTAQESAPPAGQEVTPTDKGQAVIGSRGEENAEGEDFDGADDLGEVQRRALMDDLFLQAQRQFAREADGNDSDFAKMVTIGASQSNVNSLFYCRATSKSCNYDRVEILLPSTQRVLATSALRNSTASCFARGLRCLGTEYMIYDSSGDSAGAFPLPGPLLIDLTNWRHEVTTAERHEEH